MANVSKINFNGDTLDVKDAHAREQLLHLTADNYTADVTGDYTVNAGDIAMTSKNATMHTTADREVDTDGNDSVHIDGASTLNVGGLRTETFARDKTETVTGASTLNVGGLRTEAFAGDKTETVTGTMTEKAGNRNTTITGKWMVNLPDRAFSMQDIALKNDISKLHKTVKDYGAVGDGVADDSDAIINCINHEGIVYFPSGTYKISKSLTADNKLIIGENKSSTFITMDGNGILLNAGSRTQIENITLGFTNADGAGDGEKVAINCMGTKYALQRTSVSNVNIRVCGTAIRSGKDPFFSVNFDTMEITEFTYAAVQIVTPDSTQNAFRNLYVTSTKKPEYMFITYTRMSSIYLENVNLEHTAPKHDPLIIDGCLTARINGIQLEGITLTETVGLITLNCKNAVISGFTNIFNRLADNATYGIVMHLLKCDGFGTFATSDMTYTHTTSNIVINDYTMWGFDFHGRGLTFARRTDTDPVVNLYINGFGGVTYGQADLDRYDLFVQANDNTNVFKNVNPGYGAAVPSNKFAGKSELFFDTTDSKMKYFNGTTWVALT